MAGGSQPVPLDGLEGCNRVLELLWGVWLRGRRQG